MLLRIADDPVAEAVEEAVDRASEAAIGQRVVDGRDAPVAGIGELMPDEVAAGLAQIGSLLGSVTGFDLLKLCQHRALPAGCGG
ncbi:hypothetical protein D3C87_2017810 [compost metagenome]